MQTTRISKGIPLGPHVDMARYMHKLPALHNLHYETNLLDIIDDLPEQNIRQEQVKMHKTSLTLSKDDTLAANNDHIQQMLQNVVAAYKHELDGLGNDTEVNGYQVMKAILGKGSHSFVKLAKKQGKTYAIKTISFDRLKKKYYIKDHHISKMINCEIGLLIRLRHPNIIGFQQAIYSAEKQRIFIVLEYCSKGSLQKIISSSQGRSQAQWRAQVKKYFVQIAKGLLKMHENNIIHRDMKAENVLVNEKDEVKLIDFNISAEVPPNGTITITDKFIGTKSYAPPQLVSPNSKPTEYDGRLIDVWALGVTFVELWERKHPFNASSVEELVKMQSKPYQPNSGYESNLKDLISRMLHLDNRQRIQVADILRHPWVVG